MPAATSPAGFLDQLAQVQTPDTTTATATASTLPLVAPSAAPPVLPANAPAQPQTTVPTVALATAAALPDVSPAPAGALPLKPTKISSKASDDDATPAPSDQAELALASAAPAPVPPLLQAPPSPTLAATGAAIVPQPLPNSPDPPAPEQPLSTALEANVAPAAPLTPAQPLAKPANPANPRPRAASEADPIAPSVHLDAALPSIPGNAVAAPPEAKSAAAPTNSPTQPVAGSNSAGATPAPPSVQLDQTKITVTAGPALTTPATGPATAAAAPPVITPPTLAPSEPTPERPAEASLPAAPLLHPGQLATSPATPAPPAAQLAQAVVEPVRTVLATPAQHAAEPHILSVKLDPVELGKVEIRIERSSDGTARVDLVAERPETLQRLVHDQPQLQTMLDQAGIPAANRTLHFSLATDSSATGQGFGFTSGGDPGTSGGHARPQQPYLTGSAAEPDLADRSVQIPQWARAGLDITA